jgi:hypothetical protein
MLTASIVQSSSESGPTLRQIVAMPTVISSEYPFSVLGCEPVGVFPQAMSSYISEANMDAKPLAV